MACFGPLATTVPSTAGAKALAAYAVAVLGDVTAVLVYLSPLSMFLEIWNKKSVEQHRAAPYVVGLLNSTLWFLYGLPHIHATHSNVMLGLNFFGVTMMVMYLAVFLHLCQEERRCMLFYFLIVEGIVLICLGALLFTVAHEPKDKATLLGVSAVITACCTYTTPVMDIISVCRSKNVDSAPMSVPMTGASLLNAVVWTVYSAITLDPFVLIPNGVGVLIPVVQLCVYHHFNKAPAARNAAQGN